MSNASDKDHILRSMPLFTDSGAIYPQSPSYVMRPADHDLYKHIQEGKYCYVLSAPQMGKTSLMVNVASRLRSVGIKDVIIDLALIGSDVSAEQWFLGLLYFFKRNLGLIVDINSWWIERRDMSIHQRTFEFICDIVLKDIHEKIVVFFDEIDIVINLKFRDSVFSFIKAMYNGRTSNNVLDRLSFVLFGVVNLVDLVEDKSKKSLNIWTPVQLRSFEYDNAFPLLQGLNRKHPGRGEIILRRVFYWTDGHPYLTHVLCLAAAEREIIEWDNAEVDELIEYCYSNAKFHSNLIYIQNIVRAMSDVERYELLRAYLDVYTKDFVRRDYMSPVQDVLEIYGLICVKDNKMRVNNRIYGQIFNDNWAMEGMGSDRFVENSPQERFDKVSSEFQTYLESGVVDLLYRYDVFISYSYEDSVWVEGFLLPRFHDAKLRVATPDDFIIGTPRIDNNENIISQSRYIVLVITPNWINSDWGRFQNIIAQNDDPSGVDMRTLPLLLEYCEVPRRIKILTMADLTDKSKHEKGIARLINQISRHNKYS